MHQIKNRLVSGPQMLFQRSQHDEERQRVVIIDRASNGELHSRVPSREILVIVSAESAQPKSAMKGSSLKYGSGEPGLMGSGLTGNAESAMPRTINTRKMPILYAKSYVQT